MVNLQALGISKRLFLLVSSALLGVVLVTAAALVSERSLLLEERQNAVRQTVETVHGVLASFQQQAAKGTISEEQAKSMALNTIQALRYGNGEYFWINDMQPRMVMHPIKPELNGKDLSQNQDPTGKHLFIEFVNVVKASGSGFVWYLWPKPGKEQPVQKVSFVKGFAPWGWLVGSGVYVDDVDSVIGARALMAGIGALALMAILSALGYWISRSLLHQLGGEPAYATAAMQRIARGELDFHIELRYPDPTSLLHEMELMRGSFVRIVGKVRSSSEGVALASAEIAQGNTDLSSRTEHEASSLQETSSAMEQFDATVKQNADSARQANLLASQACNVAVQGGAVVGRVVDTMKEINDSSRKISDIISVIDGIAFQTNILALNAAVEAARAGEQGRGFAVVASEVRSLAGRSAEAAREIKSLINASVERVAQGTTLVDEAGATMGEVVSSIRRVTDIMGEISSASSEQSGGVAQVLQAVVQIDQATQQNAALVEQIAATANSLKGQADELVNTVAFFKLDEHGRATSAPVRAQVARAAQFKGDERRQQAKPATRAAATVPRLAPGKPAPAPKPAAPVQPPATDDWETF
jgi:methyl-accepting chemotaxis protein